MDFLMKRSDIDPSQIMLFGRSLGGAVAIYLASLPNYSSRLAGLILENTFTSIYDMSHKILRLQCLKYIPRLCFKNKVCEYLRFLVGFKRIFSANVC